MPYFLHLQSGDNQASLVGLQYRLYNMLHRRRSAQCLVGDECPVNASCYYGCWSDAIRSGTLCWLFTIVEAMEIIVECLSASVSWEGGKQTQRAGSALRPLPWRSGQWEAGQAPRQPVSGREHRAVASPACNELRLHPD